MDSDKERFLYPIGKYYGQFTPENLVFDANLQEFAHRVAYLCGLETNGKITTREAYHEIKKLWKQLKESNKELFKDDEASDEDR